MTEAYFDNEQPTFQKETVGSKTRVQLCLNGEWKDIEYGYDEDGKVLTSHQWVCEYNEFTANTDEMPLEDIEANPSDYMDYTGPEKVSDLERIDAQVTYTALMTDTMLED